jgi:hypothetical protein
MRNEPQFEKLNTKPNNRQPPNMGRGRGSVQSIHPQRQLYEILHDSQPMSPGNVWSRPLNSSTIKLPQRPPQLYSLNKPPGFLSKYMFVPHAEISQLHYRQDPRPFYKLNSICSLRSNLPVNKSFQPAAWKPVNCETGIPSPAQNICLTH